MTSSYEEGIDLSTTEVRIVEFAPVHRGWDRPMFGFPMKTGGRAGI